MRINQSENPGPRPGVLVLFVVLSVIVITVWFREGTTGPIHRARTGVHAVAAPIANVSEVLTRPVRGLFEWASDLGVSRSQLDQLRSQNERLRKRVADLEEARLENVRLRKLVKLTAAKELETKAARVIGRPTNSWEGVITIDLGTKDGVKDGMPVLGPDGLLGQTVEVTRSSAKVRLITDQRSGVAAYIQRNRAPGIVHGSIEGQLSLDFVSREATVNAGDVVVTSGLGGVYPKGIVVGEITEVSKDAGSLYQKISVSPPGSLQGLEEVLVVIGQPAPVVPGGGE